MGGKGVAAMSCSGIHCPACAGGAAVPPVALAALLGLPWVVEHVVEVAVTSAVCGALAAAAVVALMRWQDRRQAARAAQASVWTVRAEAVTGTRVPDPLEQAAPPALGFRDLHLHFDASTTPEQAEVIRRALGDG